MVFSTIFASKKLQTLPQNPRTGDLDNIIKGYAEHFQDSDAHNPVMLLEMHCRSDAKLPERIFVTIEDIMKPNGKREIIMRCVYPILIVNRKDPGVRTYRTHPIALTPQQHMQLRENQNLQVTFSTDNPDDVPAIF